MDKKSKNTIIISIVALSIVLITVTYAYFSARITGIESASTISLTAGHMSIVYTEGNEILSFNNIYPREEAWVTKTFTLTGTNTTELDMKYKIVFDVTENTFPDNYLTYDLRMVSSTNGTPIATKTNIPINGTGIIKIGVGIFTNADDDTHNYELKIYFKDSGEDQNDAQDAIFNAKVDILEVLNEPDGWRNAPAETLLGAIKSNYPKAQTPLTDPATRASIGKLSEATQLVQNLYGNDNRNYFTYSTEYEEVEPFRYRLVNPQAIRLYNSPSTLRGKYVATVTNSTTSNVVQTFTTNTITQIIDIVNGREVYYIEGVPTDTNEAELSSTPDDYGTSYYFRGAVQNNYVVFANMCWRIVRITGDGSIKLVLYNYNPNNANNPCESTEDGDTNAFARVNGSYTSAFNSGVSGNTAIGYMYSNNPNGEDFETVHANENDSAVLTFLKTWYDENLRNYNDKIADVIWCNDKRKTSGTGLGTTTTYYYNNITHASLICSDVGSDGKLSKFTARDTEYGNAKLYSNNKEYKIGLLTINEALFAGYSTENSNTSVYLYKNALGVYTWTLSPATNNGFRCISKDTRLSGTVTLSATGVVGVRPAVALKSDVNFYSGNGTQSDPFVVDN